MSRIVVALVISIFLLAGISYSQSAVRVHKGDYYVLAYPEYTPDTSVTFLCTSPDTTLTFSSQASGIPFSKKLVTLDGTLEGRTYTFTCKIEDIPPFSFFDTKQSNTTTAKIIVHDCNVGGYKWDPNLPNTQANGNCVRTQRSCEESQICFKDGVNNLDTCITSPSGSSKEACCAANSFASYTHAELVASTSTSVTICGVTYVSAAGGIPGRDDDGDGRIDEDPVNRRDDDGDRRNDEDGDGRDGVCPRDHGAAETNVCDADCLYGGLAPASECTGMSRDDGSRVGYCTSACQPKDNTPPSHIVNGPTGWLKSDFTIQISGESDPSGITSTYSAEARRHDGTVAVMEEGAGREINKNLDVKLGGSETAAGPNCPYQGKGACSFSIYTTDNSPQHNEEATILDFDIDSLGPYLPVDGFKNDPDPDKPKEPGVHWEKLDAIVSERYPSATSGTDDASGVKFVEIHVLDSTGVIHKERCPAAQGVRELPCTTSVRLTGGSYKYKVIAGDFAGNPLDEAFTRSIGGGSLTGSPEGGGGVPAGGGPSEEGGPAGGGGGSEISTTINDAPVIRNRDAQGNEVSTIVYSGECKKNAEIAISCAANDVDGNLNAIKLWAGQCDPNTPEQPERCKRTRSWCNPSLGPNCKPEERSLTGEYVTYTLNGAGGEQTSFNPPAGSGTAQKTFAITQPIGTAIAATCQAYDTSAAASESGDGYHLCVVDGCANPPRFSNIQMSPNPTGSQRVQITFDSNKDLAKRPIVTIRPSGQAEPSATATYETRGGNSYTYSALIPNTFPNNHPVVISVTGEDFDACVGNNDGSGTSDSPFTIDYCAGVACDLSRKPAGFCRPNAGLGVEEKVYYADEGACEVVNNQGVCRYSEFSEACFYGCNGGQCRENSAPTLTSAELFSLILP